MSEDSRTIYVGNISDRVSEEILYELFLQAGPLEKVTIPKDKEGRRRKFGFVTFKHDVSVPYTLQLFEGLSLYGRSLNLKCRNGGQDCGSPSHSPGMSPPVIHPNPPNAFSPRVPQGYGAPQSGHFNRSHTWHGNLSGEGTSEKRQYHQQQGGSPSPEPYRQGPPSWSCHRSHHQAHFFQQEAGQGGWFNQASPMLPPPSLQQSSEARRQRVLRQQQVSLDAHRQHHSGRHQNIGTAPWQQQSQRYGRY